MSRYNRRSDERKVIEGGGANPHNVADYFIKAVEPPITVQVKQDLQTSPAADHAGAEDIILHGPG